MAKKKKLLVCICILGFFLLSGWIFATVEIRTEDGEPLINLDELLAGTEIGNPGSSDEGSLVTPPEESGQKTDGITGQDKPAVDETIRIQVYIKNVLYKGKKYPYDREKNEIENFEEVLREIGDKQVILQDDYAEAKTYHYVLEKVREVVGDDARITRTTVGARKEGLDEDH